MTFNLQHTSASTASPVKPQMAVFDTINLILKLSTLFLTVNIQRNGRLSGILVGGLQVGPLWTDVNANSPACFIDYRNNSSEMIVLHGNSSQTCSVNVTSAAGSYTHIEIPSYDDVFFLYVERHGDLMECAHRYFTMSRQSEKCNVTFVHGSVTLNLEGKSGIVITEIAGLGMQPHCPESRVTGGDGMKQDSNCVNVKGYREITTCELMDHWLWGKGVCYIEFPSNCNASIGNREALLQCQDDLGQDFETLLVYPSDMRILDFAREKVVKVEVNSFLGLHNVTDIHIHLNSLVMLQAGVFNGLDNVREIWLYSNYLTVIEAKVFDNLTNLKGIDLWYNNLVTLDEQVFSGMSFGYGWQHTVLSLSNNEFHSLPVNVFQGLGNVNYLYLDGNQLSTLEVGIFQDLGHVIDMELSGNLLVTFEVGLFNGLSNLIHLYCTDNRFETLAMDSFEGLYSLRYLNFDNNNIVTLQVGILHSFYKLAFLSLIDNQMTTLPTSIAPGSGDVQVLHASYNQISTLDRSTFRFIINLERLFLKGNLLAHLDPDIFKYNLGLSRIDLSANRFTEIPIIKHLSLVFLNVSDNALTKIRGDEFVGLDGDVEVYASQHEICECYVSSELQCSAHYERSPYLTCDRLLSDRVLVVLMWLIGINALCGNVFVLVWKKRNSKSYNVQDLFLSNLALSDSLMGVYMLIIGAADIYFGDSFPMQSESWRSSITCKVAGAVSITSSEASVFFVTVISIDRFINIQFPYSTNKLGKRLAMLTIVMIWIISLALGVVPSILSGINFKFYDNSHVCIGLPLALTQRYSTVKESVFTDNHFEDVLYFKVIDRFSTELVDITSGLYFSIAIFLGLNCLCYLIILLSYVGIMRAVKRSSKQSGRSRDMDEQIKMTAKVTAIVATDFCCWAPIILMGILVQTKVVVLPPSVYAWSVTFVLPLNSAINPYLYTISEVIANYRKKKAKEAISNTITMEVTQ